MTIVFQIYNGGHFVSFLSVKTSTYISELLIFCDGVGVHFYQKTEMPHAQTH